jgi:hypothetical protein
MNRPKVIIASVWAVAVILLIIGLTACGGHVHHDMPTNHGVQNGCHWVDTTTKHRTHVRVNGRWKYVTTKVHTKHLVCHH